MAVQALQKTAPGKAKGHVEYEQELNFRDLAALIRRGLLAATLVALAAAAGTWFLSREQPPVYQASSTLILSQPNTELRSFGVSLVTAPAIDANAYRAAALGTPVLRAALELLGTSDPTAEQLSAFRKKVTIRAQDNRISSLIHADVRDNSPLAASEAANAVASALLNWDAQRAQRNLQTAVDTLEAQIVSLDSQVAGLGDNPEADSQRTDLGVLRAQQLVHLNSARALLSSAVGSLEIMEPAYAPLNPIAPSPTRNAALAFVLGIFLTYGVILLRDALDTSIRGASELQRLTGIPVLAEFPKQTGLRHLPREAVGYLRTNILFSTANTDPKVILVSSAVAVQGKSSVALSLAQSFARNEHRTLLIDADLRKPVIFTEYGLDRSHAAPLEAFLQNPDDDLQAATVDFSGGLTLDVIPSFKPAKNPAELLSRSFKRFLDRQAQHYDVIIIDSAPILPVPDTLAIAPHVTGIVLTASFLDAERSSVTAALDLLNRLGLRVLGTVITNISKTSTGNLKGYGYGYGYGSSDDTPPKPRPVATPVRTKASPPVPRAN
jgi:non-specific protein-tyrosine kinase